MEGRRAAGRPRRAAAAAGRAPAGCTSRAFYDVTYPPTAASRRSTPNRARRTGAGHQAHRDGPRRVAVPEDAAGADGRDRARADERRDLPRLHPRLPVLPGRHDHPAGARAVDRRHRRDGRAGPAAPPASRRSACCRCPAPTTPRSARSPSSWPTATRARRSSLSLPSTRVDAFNIDLANEFSRNGRRSGLTFAPEGGSERLRRVINKMVCKDDLIRTVTAAYAQGWRQVKLYFMCGLPTETDEDVLEIAEMAHDVIRAGRSATGSTRHPLHRLDRRLRAQAAHAVPVGGAGRPRDGRRGGCASCATRSTPTAPSAATSACATTTASRR